MSTGEARQAAAAAGLTLSLSSTALAGTAHEGAASAAEALASGVAGVAGSVAGSAGGSAVAAASAETLRAGVDASFLLLNVFTGAVGFVLNFAQLWSGNYPFISIYLFFFYFSILSS